HVIGLFTLSSMRSKSDIHKYNQYKPQQLHVQRKSTNTCRSWLATKRGKPYLYPKKIPIAMSTVHIPRLDLVEYTHGSAAQRHQVSQDIGKAFTETGFVTITSHGMDKALIAELYQVIAAFFALPEEQKLRYEIHGLAGQRGYTPKGKEKAKDAKTPDLKEFW